MKHITEPTRLLTSNLKIPSGITFHHSRAFFASCTQGWHRVFRRGPHLFKGESVSQTLNVTSPLKSQESVAAGDVRRTASGDAGRAIAGYTWSTAAADAGRTAAGDGRSIAAADTESVAAGDVGNVATLDAGNVAALDAGSVAACYVGSTIACYVERAAGRHCPVRARLLFAAVLLGLLLFPFSPAGAQGYETRSYNVGKIDGKSPEIDGQLNDAAWLRATWENHFLGHEPVEGVEPSQQTEFAILYDQYNVYVGMKLWDTAPDSIVRRVTRRDDIDGDVAGVEFDSFDDKRTAFAFAVTAAGVKYDFIVSNDGNNEDPTWNPIWWAQVSHDSLGWYAEMRIPLTQLRFRESGSTAQEWGIQAVRFLFRKEETSMWQPISRKQASFVSQFGRLKGLQNLESRKIVDIMPYVVASTERFAAEAANPFRAKGHHETLDAGLDAKLGVTNNLTLDLTINPDFGQVEADPSQVNLSTHETFFEERRPFFIEGKNILHYGLNFGDGDLADEGMFYSRRIGRNPAYSPDIPEGSYASIPEFTRILGAAKLSGKSASGWSVGLLESMTAREFAKIRTGTASSKIAVEPFTNYAVARIQKDFHEGNTMVGGMATAVHRNLDDQQLSFLHKSAWSGGLDFVHKWDDKNWEFDLSLYGSRVAGSREAITRTQKAWTRMFQRPDADYMEVDTLRTSLSGHGGKIALGEYGGNLKFATAITWKSPGLELNDVGYLREADKIFQLLWVGYRTYQPVFIFRQINLNFNQWTQWNFGGDLLAPGGNVNLNTSLTNYWSLSTGYNLSLAGLTTNDLRGGPALKYPGSWNTWLYISTNDQKKLSFEVEGYINQSFEKEYSLNAGGEFEINWKPLNALQIEVSPEYNYDECELMYVATREFTSGNRYIFGTIRQNTVSASFRVNLNLTPDLSLQYWGQPFISAGKYDAFKRITNPRAEEYNDRFLEFVGGEIDYDPGTSEYHVREGALHQSYSFEDPNFNVREFLSNMVLRWEYNPGSTLYLVWSQGRHSRVTDGSFDLGRDLDRLFGTRPGNIFLVKLSYRLGR